MAAQAIRLLYSLLESRNALLDYEGEHRPAELHQLLRAGSHGALLRSSPKIALLIHLRSPHVCALSCDCFGLLCDEIHILPAAAAAATAAATAASAAATAAAAASSPPATAGGAEAGAEVPAVPAATPLTATNSILSNYRVSLVGGRARGPAEGHAQPAVAHGAPDAAQQPGVRALARLHGRHQAARGRPAAIGVRCGQMQVRGAATLFVDQAMQITKLLLELPLRWESADQLALLHNLGSVLRTCCAMCRSCCPPSARWSLSASASCARWWRPLWRSATPCRSAPRFAYATRCLTTPSSGPLTAAPSTAPASSTVSAPSTAPAPSMAPAPAAAPAFSLAPSAERCGRIGTMRRSGHSERRGQQRGRRRELGGGARAAAASTPH